MASNGLRIYDRAAVRIGGRYVAHSTSVRISFHSTDEIVSLLGGGTKRTFVLSPGVRLIIIQWDMVVPSDDSTDLGLIRTFLDCDRVKVGVDMFGSGLSVSSEGFLKEPTLAGSVGANLTYSITFIGEPDAF